MKESMHEVKHVSTIYIYFHKFNRHLLKWSD